MRITLLLFSRKLRIPCLLRERRNEIICYKRKEYFVRFQLYSTVAGCFLITVLGLSTSGFIRVCVPISSYPQTNP